MLDTFLIAIWFALPALVWIATICVRRRIHPALVCALCLGAMVAGYFVLAEYVRALDARLLAEVDKFDLDGDGSVSGDEWTPEARRASDEWASDTGRSFALAFRAPLTAIWYTILFVVLFGGQWLLRQLSPTRPTCVQAQTDSETEEQ